MAQLNRRSVADVVSGAHPLVIAHRGASRSSPENTLPAFWHALMLGAEAIEFDYHESADGQLVVIHDDDLIRTTDARSRWGDQRLRIDERNWSELAQLDAGTWVSPGFAGTRLSTVAGALWAITPDAIGVIERKSGSAEALCRLLRVHKFIDRVVVQAFDWEFLAACRRLEPGLALAALGEKSLTADRLDAAASLGALAVAWEDAALDAAAIAAILAHGMKAWVWTVDDLARQRQLLAWGASGLITNDPEPLLRLLGR